MTEAEPNTTDADLRPDYENAEVAEQIQEQHLETEREQEEAATKAELQKRQIMRDRGEVDEDAPPVHISHDGYDFEFRPMPEKERIWVENRVFDFVGVDEETTELDEEQSAGMRSIKTRTAELLNEYSTAGAYDREFWSDWFGVEERMELVSDITRRQNEREGNQR